MINVRQKTFKAMIEGSSREKALEIVQRHPGILAAGRCQGQYAPGEELKDRKESSILYCILNHI